mmetsp:Transcript_5973/g.10402  ORF Transcript_5973/g.10402 Transcript_5973/m.10402 type:complete len:177 (+) Transcript_5973:83-613(+)
MSLQLVPKWVHIWFMIASVLVTWDAFYSLLRPHSIAPNGFLSKLWAPYALYQDVDKIYGTERWQTGDRFCEAQSVCNLIEVGLQLAVLWLLRKKDSTAKDQSGAALLTLVVSTTTFWKTVLYWLYDIVGGFQSTGHNGVVRLVFIYLIPNGVWLVVPSMVMVQVGGNILRKLAKTD